MIESEEQNPAPEEKNKDDLEQCLRILEALFFATPEALSLKTLAEYISEDRENDLPDLLRMLQHRYQGRGIELVERGDLWAFRTAVDLAEILDIERQVSKKLSRAALETLAIVAYHQPVTRAEIESIRGVTTGKGTLDILMEATWVKPGRRRQVPGRPLTWVTTPQFLDHFGLETVKDLPGIDELKATGMLDKRSAIDNISGMTDMFDGLEDESE